MSLAVEVCRISSLDRNGGQRGHDGIKELVYGDRIWGTFSALSRTTSLSGPLFLVLRFLTGVYSTREKTKDKGFYFRRTWFVCLEQNADDEKQKQRQTTGCISFLVAPVPRKLSV